MNEVILKLTCADGDHHTALPNFNPSTMDFTEKICETCHKPFKIAFHMGLPFWDDQSVHPPPHAITLISSHKMSEKQK